MLSIVIPVLNQHDMTYECLQAVLANTKDCEIVLVDNGSDPPIKPPFSGFVPITVIRNEENKGFPFAVNQGIRAAKGETIVLLNNDVFVTPGALDRLDSWLEEYAIVGPLTNYCAGMQRAIIPTYETVDELNKEAAALAEECKGQSQEVNWVIGFCMAFKRALFDQFGSFDESLWPCSGEEIDFCFKVRAAGLRVGIAGDVYVHHEGSKTFEDLQKAGQADYAEVCKRNDDHLAEKWGDIWNRQMIVQGFPEASGIRLNLGCGYFKLPGFLNIDQFAEVEPDLKADVVNLPYEPGTVDEIYAGHILEHFRYTDGMVALQYWYLLLKPGGRISISVPDYDFLVKKYVENPSPRALMDFNDNYIYSGIQPSPHQYAYSAALLEKVMAEAGFADLRRMPIDHPYFPFPVDWQVGYTGVKP
jgi:GT2 family glycosyltransferase/predicted SAM-dependent methyltransferase